MRRFLPALLLFSTSFLFCQAALAQDILVTVSHSHQQDSHTHFWWNGPDYSYTNEDQQLFTCLRNTGITPFDPSKSNSAPKISKVAYGHAPLSQDSALNLAKLFNTDGVITGQLSWKCTPSENGLWKSACNAQGSLTMASTRTRESFTFEVNANGIGYDEANAQEAVYDNLKPSMMLAVHKTFHQNPSTSQNSEQVVVLRGIQNADALVTLRKSLRTQPGVNNIAEKWARPYDIAFEINPEQPDSPDAISAIVTTFLNTPQEGIELREVKRDSEAIIIEVLNY